MFWHFIFIILSLFGMYVVISLLVSVFDGIFGSRTQRVAMAQRKQRRMGIIAAFILLDKDRSGFLDKAELVDFLNGTAGISRHFDIKEDEVISGIEFVELCEYFVHEFRLNKRADPAKAFSASACASAESASAPSPARQLRTSRSGRAGRRRGARSSSPSSPPSGAKSAPSSR